MPRRHRTSTDPPVVRPLFPHSRTRPAVAPDSEAGRGVPYASAMPATTEFLAARRAGRAAAMTAATTARPSMMPI
ncbi:hypothetical protein LX88_002590 [Lentzea californiensis]|nr:hypothetical protein [Lentzea californiensis]